MNELDICPVKVTLSLISSKWKVLIIYQLLDGPKRYGQLKKCLNSITKKVLADSLHSLEECGLIHREACLEAPVKVEYSLTDMGRSLCPILSAMEEWGTRYKAISKAKCIK